MSKELAKETIGQLAERFDYRVEDYKKGNYNETQTRNDFINPFFEALGWDINNKSGQAEVHRDVIHEDKIKIGGKTKAPDYCFTNLGNKQFFLEAKKPSIDLKDQISPAYQLRRYGWSAKLPVSILTDFEEFSIYDCSFKPLPTDKASISRIKYLTFKDYVNEFDFLWETFSKEMVLKGSFDKYVSANKGKKVTSGVDAEFLKSLDSWRDLLARNIVIRNPEITEDELNYSLQKIMDRIIFLRICEDRSVEKEEQLFNIIGNNTYQKIKSIFHSADQKYNSGLFDYKKDIVTDNLNIDDNTLKSIIEEMYYPKSPYEFSVIPVEILGHSYEQYLGKVIKIDSKHKISIEEKPEVRKAGGVYYTPQYIVDYIVKNTVGKLVEGKTPDEIAKIKICDPACGSGSFLLGAYQYLLDWHLEYYTNADIKRKDKFINPYGNLTTQIKKAILLNNIYGVDIDTNAVEVTKLSLMLKAMEGETDATISNQLTLLHERVLPTLDNNIKSGNSLIDTDFYDNKIDFEPGAEKKIKPFNWKHAFPEVFGAGGFDVVIGNPPYFSLSSLSKYEIQYYNKYKVFDRSTDIYCLFYEKSINILRQSGKVGFITSNQWLQTNYGKSLIKLFIEFANPQILLNFGGFKVFRDATVDTSIIILSKEANQNALKACHFKNDFINFNNLNNYFDKNSVYIKTLNQEKWLIAEDSLLQLKEKIKSKTVIIRNLKLNIFRGVLTGLNEAFIISTEKKEELCKADPRNQEIIIPILRGRDVHKHYKHWANLWLIVSKNGINVKNDYPVIYNYLNTFTPSIQNRADQGENWWNLRACTYYDKFNQKKIIYPETTVRRSEFYIDTEGYYIDKTCFMITGDNLEYLNGILASKLMEWYLETELRLLGKNSIQYSKQFIEQIPIPQNPAPETQKQLVSHVEQMLQLNKDLQKVTLPEQKEQLKARIAHTDKKIDRLVYELYELTEEEIKIVEGE